MNKTEMRITRQSLSLPTQRSGSSDFYASSGEKAFCKFTSALVTLFL